MKIREFILVALAVFFGWVIYKRLQLAREDNAKH